MTGLPDRVRCGAEFLDRWEPGWAGRVDLARLDLCHPCNCVIGQIFAPRCDDYDDPYEAGVQELDLDGVEAAHGFILGPHNGCDVDGRVDPDALDRAWAELDRLWAAEIRARLVDPDGGTR